MKKMISLFLLVILVFTTTACSDDAIQSTTREASPTIAAAQQNSEIALTPISVEYNRDDLDSSVSNSNTIRLVGDSITFEGSGATINNNSVTITSAGVYNISGSLNNGQIVIDSTDKETIVLVLNGADITCLTSAPIYVSNADKVVITLADGTENHVTDGASYVLDAGSDEPNAAIFSKDDLTINGNGSLTVNANYNDGIVSKDDLKITGGSIAVNAVNDGIKGKDLVAVQNGTIIINAGGDGLQSNNDEEAAKGYVAIEGGALNIVAGLDGIQAETRLMISNGEITITSGGGSVNTSASGGGIWGRGGMEGNPNKPAESAKGLKAGVDITITGGVININSADDSIHSNNSITIDGGNILLTSGDDGAHADASLTINNGDLRITQSYEGIESAAITINNGTIHVVASDDGINAAGGADGSSINGRPGQNPFEMSGNYNLHVNGGYIVVDAIGDGLDINGPIDMSGGFVIVNGPTANNNGAVDYTGAFNITGGFLVAVGSSGMAQAPSASSTQYSVMHTFPSPQAAGTLIHIEAEDGQEILTFTPTKPYQSIVVSSPKLKNGVTYLVHSGGSSTGTVADGLYSGGTYTAGVQVASFTISSIVTGAGAARGGFSGGPGEGPPPQGGFPGGPGEGPPPPPRP